MKIYIAGPITNTPNYKQSFDQKEADLISKGYQVINPAILPEGFLHSEYMHICYAMIDVCDAITLLPGWEESKGAQLEFNYAVKKEKFIFIK